MAHIPKHQTTSQPLATGLQSSYDIAGDAHRRIEELSQRIAALEEFCERYGFEDMIAKESKGK